MQYSVPQFTEVEDKIIGSLTIKQFGIIFATGVVVFLAYTVTKSIIVLILFSIFIGIPALALAFAKLNGRPMYNMIGYFVGFLTSAKILVFQKEGVLASDNKNKENQDSKMATTEAAVTPQTSRQRLVEVNKILQEQAEEERELLKK